MKIKNIKKVGNKYKIILDTDEVITTNDHVIINSNLLYEKKLSKKELEKIKEDTKYYENYDKILKMINRKIRSEHEIRKTLNKNGVSKIDEDKMITSLKEIGARAFHKTSNLKGTLELPENLEKLGSYGFAHCSSFNNNSVIIPKSIKEIGDDELSERYDEFT